jgi:hypothetical protein
MPQNISAPASPKHPPLSIRLDKLVKQSNELRNALRDALDHVGHNLPPAPEDAQTTETSAGTSCHDSANELEGNLSTIGFLTGEIRSRV